jgi:hypothetical protein
MAEFFMQQGKCGSVHSNATPEVFPNHTSFLFLALDLVGENRVFGGYGGE